MSRDFTLATCALFGNRPERDRKGYYYKLVNDLACKTDIPLVVATNDPTPFSPQVQTFPIRELDSWRESLWEEDNWQDVVKKNLGWHPRNQGLAQYHDPGLVGVYLAKTAIMLESARRYGDIVWIDAGVLFSVLYHHDVPDSWHGYTSEAIRQRLIPLIEKQGDRPLFAHKTRKWRPFKSNRPQFHGMSYNDMSRLASACSAKPDDKYVVAPFMFLPQSQVEKTQAQFKEVWLKSLKLGRAGTEETVLSVIRWQEGYESMSTEDWILHLRDGLEP